MSLTFRVRFYVMPTYIALNTYAGLTIIEYGSTIYRDHEGLGILAQNYHPKTSLIFTF